MVEPAEIVPFGQSLPEHALDSHIFEIRNTLKAKHITHDPSVLKHK